uniref:Secreted protein n=1 Tax=Panagrellus redivivus TaxID=6233 RepID=A0A7E4W583_PANRE
MGVVSGVLVLLVACTAADGFLKLQNFPYTSLENVDNRVFYPRARRDPPVCAVKEKANEKVQQSIMSNALSEDSVLQYLGSEDAESTRITEECSDSHYNQDVLADMHQGSRAICPFRSYDDIDKQRIPMRITKVECLCNPTAKNGKRNSLGCEKMIYRMPVLKFDAACSEYVETTEDVVLACVPVFSTRRTVNTNALHEALSDQTSSSYA